MPVIYLAGIQKLIVAVIGVKVNSESGGIYGRAVLSKGLGMLPWSRHKFFSFSRLYFFKYTQTGMFWYWYYSLEVRVYRKNEPIEK